MNETRFVLFALGRASHPSIIALAYLGKQTGTLLSLLHYVQSRCPMAERPTLLSWRSRDARSADTKKGQPCGQPLGLLE
jgi:hypothetical protein